MCGVVVSRRLPPPLVAGAMFLTCLLIGTASETIVRLRPRPAPYAGLTVAVRSGHRGMRIENLTGSQWSGCVVTLEGGWRSRPFAIDAGGVQRLRYDAFSDDAQAAGDAGTNGFSRAFRQTMVRCRDDAGRWQTAAVR